MFTVRSKSSSGSVLVMVLFLLVVLTCMGVAWLKSSQRNLKRAGKERAATALELQAETGLNLAKQDLLKLGNDGTFSAAPAYGKFKSGSGAASVGLIPNGGATTDARLTVTNASTEINVWYYPSETNSAVDNEFPKTFRVVSEATNLKNSERHTVEGFVSLGHLNFADISFGVLHPTKKVTDPNFQFRFHPGVYEGLVYFGNFEGVKPIFDESTKASANASHCGVDSNGDAKSCNFRNQTFYDFRGPVLFFADLATPTDRPFVSIETSKKGDEDDEVLMQKGFKAGYKLPESTFDDAQLDQQYTNIVGDSDSFTVVDLDAGTYGGKRCIQFQSDGTAKLHECNDSAKGALDRYKTSPSASTVVLSGPTVFRSENDVEVRGVLKGQATVLSSTNVRIGGDIQYADQSDSSIDKLGVVAKNDVVIPAYIPLREKAGLAVTSSDETTYNNVTNFKVTNDRDAHDPEYAFPQNFDGTFAADNKLNTLDLDGSFVAIKGKLDFENLNGCMRGGADISPVTGVCIPDRNGTNWSLDDTTKPEYAYTLVDQNNMSSNIVSRSAGFAEPRYCFKVLGNPDTTPCPLRNEAPRQPMEQMVVYGSIVTKEYSKMNMYIFNRLVGFRRKVMKEDRRGIHPPAFPESSGVSISEVWRKTYSGRSDLVASTHP